MEYHDLTAKQKGGVGEALLASHAGYATDVVESWIADDLRGRFEVADDDRIRVTHDHRVETYYLNHEGAHVSWTPDCLFTAWLSRGFGPLQSPDERRVDYPMEVKTGEYAEPERNQGRVMALLATREDVVPTVANVTLDELPEQFGVALAAAAPADAAVSEGSPTPDDPT